MTGMAEELEESGALVGGVRAAADRDGDLDPR